jgi:hypothetical protein
MSMSMPSGRASHSARCWFPERCSPGDKARVGGFIEEPATPLLRSNHDSSMQFVIFLGPQRPHPPLSSRLIFSSHLCYFVREGVWKEPDGLEVRVGKS